jgi:hypothetical protein
MPPKRHVKSGPARMRELGHTPVTIWFPPPALAKLDRLRRDRPRATFVGKLIFDAMRQLSQYEKAS